MTVAARRTRAQGDEGGFTLVEVLVAAFLLMGGFAMLVNTIVSMNNASRRNDERQLASMIAFNYLERVRALGCGLVTGSETQEDLDAIAARCTDDLGLGDGRDSFYDASGTAVAADDEYEAYDMPEVRLRLQPWATWDVAAAAGNTCGEVADPNTVVYPDSVLRTVQTMRRDGSGLDEVVRTYTVRETVSPDRVTSAPQSTGAIVIRGFDGDHAAIAAMTWNGRTVERRSGGRPCIWLPFVPAGTHDIDMTSDAGASAMISSVTVQAGRTTVLDCASSGLPSGWCA